MLLHVEALVLLRLWGVVVQDIGLMVECNQLRPGKTEQQELCGVSQLLSCLFVLS